MSKEVKGVKFSGDDLNALVVEKMNAMAKSENKIPGEGYEVRDNNSSFIKIKCKKQKCKFGISFKVDSSGFVTYAHFDKYSHCFECHHSNKA